MSNKITIDRSVLEQALEALINAVPYSINNAFIQAQAAKALRNALAQPAAQPTEPAYTEAVSLATALFKKHFAHEEHYVSGRIVWAPCDTTAGVISQIDNMVSGLIQPTTQQAPAGEPVAVFREDDDIGHIDLLPYQGPMLKDGDKLYTRPAVPLTDEFLLSLWSGSDSPRPVLGKNKVLAFARAIEAAHKIGGAE
jgi:hypothetical protein